MLVMRILCGSLKGRGKRMRESAFVRFRLLAVLILAAAMVAAGVLLSGALTARAAEEPTALTKSFPSV